MLGITSEIRRRNDRAGEVIEDESRWPRTMSFARSCGAGPTDFRKALRTVADVNGTPQPKQATSNSGAWLGGNYKTIRLAADVDAVRVHVGAGVGAARREALAVGAGSAGRWFAVGDVILTRSAYTDSRALPSGFTRVDWCRIKAGSIVNIGRCSPLFGHLGGGEQVEFLSGPRPEQTTVPGNWSEREGRG